MTQNISASSRWLLLIIGALSIVFGFMIFGHPVQSYATLTFVFCIAIIFIGISEIINAASIRPRAWGWSLAMGIIDCLIGFILFLDMNWTAQAIPYIMGFIMIYWGISFISTAVQPPKTDVWGLIAGILTLFVSFMIIFHPLFGMFDLVVWTSLAFIFGGIGLIIRAFNNNKEFEL